MGKSDHYDLGYAHCVAGIDRYKFQDPYLQEQYDKGWMDAANGKSNKEFMLRRQLEQLQNQNRKAKW